MAPAAIPPEVRGVGRSKACPSPEKKDVFSSMNPTRSTPFSAVQALLMASLALLSGCYAIRGSSGGGQTNFSPPREVNPADVAVPPGYRVEVVAIGLTFPTGIAFDQRGVAYVVESGYSYGEAWTEPRLVRIAPEGLEVVIAGGRNGPWNGIFHHEGSFYIAEGGVLEGGRILRVSPEGTVSVLIDGLPSYGDHHTNGPVVGPDGDLYFGQGTATNSGIVGEDNKKMGWLERRPDFHDVPGESVELRGINFSGPNLLSRERRPAQTGTGAFAPYGEETSPGTRIAGATVASGSVVRVPLNGGAAEQVAWGFRNPFGLAFSPEGQLYVTDNGYDNRGSRPVWGAADFLWRVEEGLWYGWPDFSGDHPLTDDWFQPPGKKRVEFLLATHPNNPPAPVARLGVHSSSNGLDFSSSSFFGYTGHAFIAQWGDLAPDTNKVMGPVGFKVVRVDPASGNVEDFAVNRGPKNGPASRVGGGGLERPIAARFAPDGSALYIVDFGVVTMKGTGPHPHPGTGVIWRVVREEVRP
jgi:glucose/arabinose dehydrogenase